MQDKDFENEIQNGPISTRSKIIYMIELAPSLLKQH